MKHLGGRNFMLLLLCLALLSLAARAVLIWRYPQSYGDAAVYLTVAENILRNACVSLSDPLGAICRPHWGGNQLPGYPAFIAASFAFFDHSLLAVRLLQALLTSLAIINLCAALRAWSGSLTAAGCVGVLLALSPLAIGWPRHLFTESLALAVTTWLFAELIWSLTENRLRSLRLGLILASAAFLRTDLLSLCLPVAVCAFMIHPPRQAIRKGLIVVIGLVLPLAGWSLRSVSHDLPPLPPMAVIPDGSPVPDGFLAWGGTWSSKEYHLNLWLFPALTKTYSAIAPPPRAYADADERARVEKLLEALGPYDGKAFPPSIDRQFEQIASAKRQNRPLFHWLALPLRRSFEMWFNPFTSAGLPAAAELPGAITPDKIRLAVTKGIMGVTDLILRYPELTLFKAVSISYRVILVLTVLVVLAFAARGVHPVVHKLLTLGLVFALGRTVAFALTFNSSTRYIVEAAVPLEIVCGVFIGLYWKRWRDGRGST
jgi:hypothetical protein